MPAEMAARSALRFSFADDVPIRFAMFTREKPVWEQEEEKFIHRYFGPIVPIMAAAVYAVLHLDLPLGVAFALVALIAAAGVYLIGLLVVAFWRRRKLRVAHDSSGDTE